MINKFSQSLYICTYWIVNVNPSVSLWLHKLTIDKKLCVWLWKKHTIPSIPDLVTTRKYNLELQHLTKLFTWLWWWLLLRFLKCQSPLLTTVLLRITLTQMISLHYHMLPPHSNHLLYTIQSLAIRPKWFKGHTKLLTLKLLRVTNI